MSDYGKTFLDGKPLFFPQHTPNARILARVERGGLPAPIPDEDKCPSGRHNLRLTSCWCTAPEFHEENSAESAEVST